MSKLTPENSEQLKQLKKQIEIDLKEISNGLSAVTQAMDDSIMSAWQVGNSLVQAKAIVGHGNFETWWQTVTGLSNGTVHNYMRLAKFTTLGDLPKNKRAAYQLMGIMPVKGKIEGTNNSGTNPPPDGFMQIVGKWHSWMTDIEEKHIQYDPEEVRHHYRPMYDWLKGLYGE